MNWAHRTTENTSGDDKFNRLVGLQAIDATLRKKVRRLLRATHDLEQDWNRRGLEACPIHRERAAALREIRSSSDTFKNEYQRILTYK